MSSTVNGRSDEDDSKGSHEENVIEMYIDDFEDSGETPTENLGEEEHDDFVLLGSNGSVDTRRDCDSNPLDMSFTVLGLAGDEGGVYFDGIIDIEVVRTNWLYRRTTFPPLSLSTHTHNFGFFFLPSKPSNQSIVVLI